MSDRDDWARSGRSAADSTTDLGPTSWSSRPGGQSAGVWRPHLAIAGGVGIALVALPLVVSIAVGLAVSVALSGGIVSIVGAVVAGALVAALARRSLVWAMPLPALFRLTLVFPDRLPSRFAVALRSGAATRTAQEQATPTFADAISLVAALTTHDPRLRGHSERVRAYADLIAAELRLPADDRAALSWAALLHDVGKLRVDRAILDKTDELSPSEWAVLRSHTEEGRRLVEPLAAMLGPWAGAVSDHHERWDGSGYPQGLAGEEISFAGRLVAVADAFDVMTSNRSYQRARSVDEARAELLACAGTQFDPEVVRAMLAVRLPALRAIIGLPAFLVAALAAVRTVLEQTRIDKVAAPAGVGAASAAAAIVLGVIAAPELTPPTVEPAPSTTVEVAGPPPARPAPLPVTSIAPTLPPLEDEPLPPDPTTTVPPTTTAGPTTTTSTTTSSTTTSSTTTTVAPPVIRPVLRASLPPVVVRETASTIEVRDLFEDLGTSPVPEVTFGPGRLGEVVRGDAGAIVYRPRPRTSGFDRVEVRLADDPDAPPTELPIVVLSPTGGARLTVATATDRTDATDLAGTVTDRPVAVVVEPGEQIALARFFLDDPGRVGPPRQVEQLPAFDFGGTEADGTARLVRLPTGRHNLSVEVTYLDGTTWLLVHELIVGPAPVT